MSNIALNSSIYQLAKKYIQEINYYLIQEKHFDSPEIENKIKNFLVSLVDEENLDPHLQLLTTVIDRSLRDRSRKKKDIVNSVLKGFEVKDFDLIKNNLSLITEILESEAIFALNRSLGTR